MSQLQTPINTSLKPSELKQYCEQYGEHRTQTYSTENYSSTDRSRAGSLETFATESLNQYRRDLKIQDKRLQQLETTLGNLISLIKDLKNSLN